MKAKEVHYRCLESMYQAAPFNALFMPNLSVNEGRADISIELTEQYHHAGGAVHGSVYFKMLDDAAFFAANSIEPDYFVLTTSFTTYLTRPVSTGKMIAKGRVVNKNRSQIIAEAVVYNEHDKEIGRGNGIFVRSKNKLVDVNGYNCALD
ncbi:PaaI family thioesterase [Marinicella rhabdoformis]|uniref:PaaI family thioesterase n=1 Tax=Marinicella rhabdoformis TaxID=2580566 RepID=UPI0012AEDBFB|nr:PaaI family thioesterase [Marinicella rhabdoformis]